MHRPLIYTDSVLKEFNFTSLHSNRVCVLIEGDVNLITVSINDEIHLYEYDKEKSCIKHLSKIRVPQPDKSSKHRRNDILSSVASRKGKEIYSIDTSGILHVTKINHNALSSHIILTKMNCHINNFLLDHFDGMRPHFSEIRLNEHNIFVLHGTRKSIHVLSQDGEFIHKAPLGTYASSLTPLDDHFNVFATTESNEIVLYDIRASNSTRQQYAQRLFTGSEKLLDITNGPRGQLMASGFSRSLCFVDIRMRRTLAQVATKSKYEINFVSCAQRTETGDYVAFVAGTDAEFKIIDLLTKRPLHTFHADDCWSGRPSVHDGIVAGVSCHGSLIVADYKHVLDLTS